MFAKLLVQLSGVLLKVGYVAGVLWLYASRPLVLAVSLVMLSLFALLAVSAQTRR